MKNELLPLLRDPQTHDPLETPPGAGSDMLLNPKTGKRFPVRGGIPYFLEDSEVSGSNEKFQGMYDRLAPFYDIPYRIAYRFFRRKFLAIVDEVWRGAVEEKEGGRVLEVSIGTGFNRRYFARDVSYVGLDLSPGMLRQCRKNLAEWGLEAELVRGNAEKLPFADDSFDVVFHFGGINFFNDKARAINEMIRVAKPGTKIVISDETEKFMKFYLPVLWKWTRKRREPIVPPVDLVPPEMLQIRCEDGWKGRFYRVSFRKPG